MQHSQSVMFTPRAREAGHSVGAQCGLGRSTVTKCDADLVADDAGETGRCHVDEEEDSDWAEHRSNAHLVWGLGFRVWSSVIRV